MGTLRLTTVDSRALICENMDNEDIEYTTPNARDFIIQEQKSKKEPKKKIKPNPIITHFLRWWILFCTFMLLTWIEVRNNEEKPIIYCMDEVLSLAVDLNVSNASPDQWLNSNISTQMDDCAIHMEKNMVPNCDPLYWTYFTRSMLALQAIEYALINIGGDMVQQWISMDTCIKPLNMSKLIPPLQCKETTAYTHCLEKFTDMSNSSTIGYGSFEQTGHQEALLQNGLPFLKHIVSHIKLNVSRVFQNVTCGCVFGAEQKKVIKIGHSKLRFADVAWCALMAFVFSCIYVFIQKCLDGSLKRRLLKVYDYMLGSIWHADGGHVYIRRRNSFSDKGDTDANEPIPLQQINTP